MHTICQMAGISFVDWSALYVSVMVAVADVKQEGWLYRESTVLDGVVNARFAVVLPHSVVSFRCIQEIQWGH